MDFGTGPSLGGEGRQDQWWRCEIKNEVCSCQIEIEITGKIYVKHLDWRRVGAAPLSATFMLTLQLLPHSLQSRHIFSPRSLHFSIQFTPLPSLSSSPPSLQLSFAPSAVFYSLFRNQSAPGENLCCSLCLPVRPSHSPLLAFLIFSPTHSFPFTIQ